MFDPAFLQRLGILLAVLSVAALIDKLVYRKQATRWKEYLVMLAGGGVGGVFGVVHDQLTVRISPAYYQAGKGLDGNHLALEAVFLGLQSGFVAGVILTGILLLRAPWPIPRHQVVNYLQWLLLCAWGFALAGAVVGSVCIPGSWVDVYHPPADEVASFRWVMGEHYGLYLGAMVGCLTWCVRHRGGARAAAD